MMVISILKSVHDHSGGNVNQTANSLNKESGQKSDGLVKIGRACYACYAGNLSFESNVPVWVTYDDKLFSKKSWMKFSAYSAGFIGIGFGGLCCGIIFLIIGIIMALTMKDNGEQQMMYMPPTDNQLIAQQAWKSNHHSYVTT